MKHEVNLVACNDYYNNQMVTWTINEFDEFSIGPLLDVSLPVHVAAFPAKSA